MALDELKRVKQLTNMLQKVAVALKHTTEAFLNLQDYFACTSTGHTEKSTFMNKNYQACATIPRNWKCHLKFHCMPGMQERCYQGTRDIPDID